MEITREQFDEHLEGLKKVRESLRHQSISEIDLDVAVEKFKEMFPQFAEPKFRKCYLAEEDLSMRNITVDPVLKQIDTTLFQIVVDDEGFYVVRESTEDVWFFSKHGQQVNITKLEVTADPLGIKAQQILEYLDGLEAKSTRCVIL